MKKYIILFFSILLLGSLAIFLPGFLSTHLEGKEVKNMRINEINYNNLMQDISSSNVSIEVQELSDSDIEPEVYSKDQMYFNNMESLYNYFMIGQVEDIKYKVQSYVHYYISSSILECSLISDSIRQNNNIFTFEFSMKDVKYFEIKVTKDKDNEIVDITIFHSL